MSEKECEHEYNAKICVKCGLCWFCSKKKWGGIYGNYGEAYKYGFNEGISKAGKVVEKAFEEFCDPDVHTIIINGLKGAKNIERRNKKLIKEKSAGIASAIDNEVNLELALDGFFGRVRKCKYCRTPTNFDYETGERYCPKGCFKGNNVLPTLKDRVSRL